MNECAGVQLTCQQCDPFPTQRYMAREDTTFVVEIGPSANPRGYTGITGMSTLCVSMCTASYPDHVQAFQHCKAGKRACNIEKQGIGPEIKAKWNLLRYLHVNILLVFHAILYFS